MHKPDFILAQSYGIEGTKLVVASDGSLIDDDETLKFLSKELIMILGENETWEADISFSLPAFLETSTLTLDQQRKSLKNLIFFSFICI